MCLPLRTFIPCRLVTEFCPILCHPMDCSLPGSSVHGILQVRILECVAISSSRGSSQPRGSNLGLLHWQADSLPSEPPGKPVYSLTTLFILVFTGRQGLGGDALFSESLVRAEWVCFIAPICRFSQTRVLSPCEEGMKDHFIMCVRCKTPVPGTGPGLFEILIFEILITTG